MTSVTRHLSLLLRWLLSVLLVLVNSTDNALAHGRPKYGNVLSRCLSRDCNALARKRTQDCNDPFLYGRHNSDIVFSATCFFSINFWQENSFCFTTFALVKRRKLKWYGHVTRSDGLTKVILQGTVEGSRRRGRPKKRWSDNIAEWTGKSFAETQAMAHNRQEWRELTRKSIMTRPYGSLRS